MGIVMWTLSATSKSEKGEMSQRVLGTFETKRAMVREMERVRAPKTPIVNQGQHCYLISLPSK